MTTGHTVAITRQAGGGESLGVRAKLSHTLAYVSGSRAAWLFTAAWLAAALTLVLSGQGFPFGSLILVGIYMPLSLVTVLLTRPAPPAPAATSERPRIHLQVGLILLFVVLTGWSGLVFHDVVAGSIPVWTPLVDALGRLGDMWFGAATYVTNPVTYVALPLIVLLLAGAHLRSLGFGRGHRIGRVLLLWGSIPLAFFAVALVSGQLALGRLLGRFVSNFMQNGLMEEFLFRERCRRGSGGSGPRRGRWSSGRSCSASGISGSGSPTPATLVSCRRSRARSSTRPSSDLHSG